MRPSAFSDDASLRAPHGTIGNAIRMLREKRLLSQRQLAKKVGVSQPCIVAWENGRMCPSMDNAKRLADEFNVPIEYLLAHRRRLFAA